MMRMTVPVHILLHSPSSLPLLKIWN